MALKEVFFYTTDTPHQWSSGATIHIFNSDWQPIESLEQAKELAEKNCVGSSGQHGYIKTTYGVYYEEE